MTPLEKIIGEIIAAEGPMPIDRYMGLCLGHPVHGYYMTGDPFGERGDFMTAPGFRISSASLWGVFRGGWCHGNLRNHSCRTVSGPGNPYG